ncbi:MULTISPECIES: glycosyl hydrolase [Streptomyces]|uniref:Glycosyl hydrolase n=1 Tax=Streptomyces albidoflavus TaxID=1886 RepID=A0AA37BUC6_9ACTN|nr:glycosyl hydrolase [Streptomyces albidoflavus]RZE62356.1 glycosyl hydrolase [Streptomyces albidoflavus]WQG70554.1 glycosyl hydrolase [Streptomyces albidoflavus]GHI44860.1 hypothetical protein ScoT_10340 [Streptomyces albidoflavus]
MNDILDFGLDDLSPVDDDSEEAMEALRTGDLTVLSQHHTTPNGSHSFVLAHDRSVTWGIPGEPQLVAIAVARDLRQSTFTFETSHHATASFAQNWLAERGCPLERIALRGGDYIEPADDLTLQVEQQIQKSGTRYEVLDTYASDDNPSEAWTLVNDSQATQAPVRLFYEEWNHGAVVRARIARIALSRSAGTSPTPQTGLDAPRATAAVPVQRAVQGRLL